MIEDTYQESSLRNIGFRLSITSLLFLLMFTVQTGQAEDFDQDGVHDANDLCLTTELNGPVPTGILCDGCMGDDLTILGCNASDVLACKPGPNKRQYEMGINQHIQGMFSAQKGWAAKCGCDDNSDPDSDGLLSCVDDCPLDSEKSLEGICGCGTPDTDTDGDGSPDCVDACPNNPGTTVPDENGNCASDSQIIVAGEQLVLTIGDSSLSIPADALAAGMTVTLAEMGSAVLGTPPNSTGESLITPVYVLDFSATQIANAKLSFTFDIPSSMTTGFYARAKIEGGIATEGQSDSDWVIVPGEYDTQQSELTIEIVATATRYLITGISADAVNPTSGSGVLIKEIKDSVLTVTQSSAETGLKSLFPVPEWASHGWVVFCDKYAFASFGLTSCDPSSPDFEAMMNDLGSKLYASDKVLTALGFPKGEVTLIHADAISRMSTVPHVIYDPDNRTTTGDPSYFQAWVDPDDDGPDGSFDPSFFSGTIFVDRLASDRSVIHELMHAVQFGEIRNAWSNDWIIEGLASAISFYAPSSTSSSSGGREYRWMLSWRDWQFPLSSDDNNNEYEASEFWLSLDGTLDLFPSFHNNLGSKGDLFSYSAYLTVDDAMTESGLPSLRDGYTNLIGSRDIDPGYDHCNADPVLVCADRSCNLQMDTAPYSAQCFDVYDVVEQFELEDQLCSDGYQPDIKVTLVTDPGQFPLVAIKLMLNGDIHDVNTPVTFEGGRLWAINTAYTDNGSPTEAILKFEGRCEPYISLVFQDLISAAEARATDYPFDLLSPAGLEISREWYRSFDDLTQDSFISTLVVSGGVGEETSVTVPPLGEAEWASVHSSSAVSQHNEDVPVSTATASSSFSTVTVSDETSMTTIGVQVATATRTLDAQSATASNAGLYRYATSQGSAELTVSWGCDMSYVFVQYTTDNGALIPLLSTSNSLQATNDWECAPKSWTIPSGSVVQVRVGTSYQLFRDEDGTVATWQNGGGEFEIHLQAIGGGD